MITTRKPDGTHRVVITGTGAVSPAGIGVGVLWEKLLAKECCISELTRFGKGIFEVKVAAQVPPHDVTELGLSKKDARRFALFVQYAIIASDEAIRQAGIDFGSIDPTRFGCAFGSGIGGMEEFESGCKTLAESGPTRVNPLFIPTMITNMAAGNLSIRYGLRGECTDVVTACATGTHNIGSAYRSIRHGYLDLALAGGSEEPFTPVCLAGFTRIGALTKAVDPLNASLPFDARRGGFVAGEGAGAVVLESLEHALARQARIIAEVVGFGSTADAYHMTAPSPDGEGLTRSMRHALDEGGFTVDDIGHVNAHGTGTPINDRTEAAALLGLGAAVQERVPVVSIKGAIGHTMAAAGALEAIVTALSVAGDLVPPTTGFAVADPECPVRVLIDSLEAYPQKVALSNSLGFGGHNATLAISPYRS
ncbi:MAG: beta-ketoacyl-[acyl-carrier-protein] synthase family protein [Eggerthellaceae bacterium]|nr:beta-ketoacyl-[acyl-carrier-protein] synthase family protein [Eggerthellaceae bacterium]